MTGAAHNRGSSKQDYSTPQEFIDAVEERFECLAWDLAANHDNAKTADYITEAVDSFTIDWHTLNPGRQGMHWLNPPFSNIRPWAQKCREEHAKGARITLLVPASVGSNWFAEHVDGHALVMPLLGPRLSFDGKGGYPKDLMLCVYGPFDSKTVAGFSPWRWRERECTSDIDLRQMDLFGDDK